jgi:hypothetical protein
VNPTDWILAAIGFGSLFCMAWYKGVFGRLFASAPISTLPTSPEQQESVYHIEKGVLMAIQEGHKMGARRIATRVQQEAIDTVCPPLPPSPSGAPIIRP